MWSYDFTSKRSAFCEKSRVGLHVSSPGAKASEAATAEAVRLALEQRFRVVLVDAGAALSAGTALRSDCTVIVRLPPDCDVAYAAELVSEVGVIRGFCVPWPQQGGAEAFAATWRALLALDVTLGTDHLDVWQLERLDVDPAFNLVTVGIEDPKTRIVEWCHGRGIQVLGLVVGSDGADAMVAATAADLCVSPWLLRLRWTVHRGIVAFPDVGDWVRAGTDLKDADAYHKWMTDFTAVLRTATLHLHAPAERRRIDFAPELVARLSRYRGEARA